MDRAPAEASALVELFGRYGVPATGRVLDVACGIGRLSIPLAERGYRVTGIDISSMYIQRAGEYAAEAGADARFVEGDMRQAEVLLGDEVPFDAFINMFTSNGYYGRDADLDLFQQLRRLASPGALLVVLTINRDWLIRNFEPEGLERAGHIRVLQNRTLNLETSSIHSDWEFYEGQGEGLRLLLKLEMEHRVYSLDEFKALLEEAGWDYLQGLGGHRGTEIRLDNFTYDFMEMWVVAQNAGT
jgi:SAM-dependent methyltransferase